MTVIDELAPPSTTTAVHMETCGSGAMRAAKVRMSGSITGNKSVWTEAFGKTGRTTERENNQTGTNVCILKAEVLHLYSTSVLLTKIEEV